MTDKQSPEVLLQIHIPNPWTYVHNIWPSEDRKRVVTTEETRGQTVKIWNIEDLNNVYVEGIFWGESQLAHNAIIKGDRVYVSHYEDGLMIADISVPSAPQIIGQWDADNSNDDDYEFYNGAWGVFPLHK